MAYQFTDDDGNAKISGSPSRTERAMGAEIEARLHGELEEWDPEVDGELP